ncbi:MAG: rhomboid family intramembrane serine protease [Candidatus Helarchaeota archaeon]|nr:rhomboid family intramembrane serine protease [Candidatus Helarchaeota archaeon]
MVIEEPRPKKGITWFTYALIIICFIVFFLTLDPSGMMINASNPIVQQMWFVPAEFFQGQNLYTLVTAAFLHGDWIHIISNMYFLWIFGDDCEDIMGHTTFLIFYLFCAIVASVFFSLITAVTAAAVGDPNLLLNPCIGASGAIFGVMAAYAIFLPNRTLMIPGMGRITAKIYIIFYAIMETLYIVFATGDNVAHAAHVGGFLAGVFFAFAFKKLFQEKFQHAKIDIKPAGFKPSLKKRFGSESKTEE